MLLAARGHQAEGAEGAKGAEGHSFGEPHLVLHIHGTSESGDGRRREFVRS